MRYVTIFARNVYFPDEKKYFKSISKDQPVNVKNWIKSTLRYYFYNTIKLPKLTEAPEDAPDWLIRDLENHRDVYDLRVIPSRLKAAVLVWLDYLRRMYPKNKTISLSVAQLREKLKHMSGEFNLGTESLDDIKIICYTSDRKYVWVQLKSPEAFVREGEKMYNCLKDYDEGDDYPMYYLKHEQGNRYYSLRTVEHNIPCVSMEMVHGNKIGQVQGKGNSEVDKKYYPYILEFLNDHEINWKSLDKGVAWGFIQIGQRVCLDNAKSIYNELKRQRNIRGHVDLSQTHCEIVPEVTISGNLDLSYSQVEELEEGIVIGGDLHLEKAWYLHRVPPIRVHGAIYISKNSEIEFDPQVKAGRGIITPHDVLDDIFGDDDDEIDLME